MSLVIVSITPLKPAVSLARGELVMRVRVENLTADPIEITPDSLAGEVRWDAGVARPLTVPGTIELLEGFTLAAHTAGNIPVRFTPTDSAEAEEAHRQLTGGLRDLVLDMGAFTVEDVPYTSAVSGDLLSGFVNVSHEFD